MPRLPRTLLAAAALAAPGPAIAELESVSAAGFVSRHQAQIEAPPARAYEALGRVGDWWDGGHTYSGIAANMSMPLEAGGCFCERWERNSIEHARVIYAAHGKGLRLEGALGPLQSMAVSGILHFAIAPRESGSTIALTYRVRANDEAALDKVAPVVDRVMGEALRRLAAHADGRPLAAGAAAK